jgi:single-strand DNA-binding protein
MANANKLILIGRLTRDVELKTFANGGAVANIGFCVNERKKDSQGNWVDHPIWLDLKAFNSQNSQMATQWSEWFRKGDQVYVEGRLSMESWTDSNTNAQRTKLVVIVERFQSLKPPVEGGQQGQPQGGYAPQGSAQNNQGGSPRQQRRQQQAPQSNAQYDPNYGDGDMDAEDIPF